MNLDGFGNALVERSLESWRNLHRGANLLLRDLIFPILSIRNDFEFLIGPQGGDNRWRVFAANNHHLGNFFLRLANQDSRERNHPGNHDGEDQKRNEDGGNESTAVAKPLGEFFAIYNSYRMKIHDGCNSALAGSGPTTL